MESTFEKKINDAIPLHSEGHRHGGVYKNNRTSTAKKICRKKPFRKDQIYAVLNHDKIDDDTDLRKGTILKIGRCDSVLVKVRTVSDSTSVCVWPRELCEVNGYAPQRRLLSAFLWYKKSKNTLNARSFRIKCVVRAERILKEFLRACMGNPSLTDEIKDSLELLRYYKEHLDWQQGYPNGERFFMCHIGTAILILED